MSGLAWGGLVIGLVVVALAVGIPYFLTHRRMHDPHDVSDSRAYLRERRRWAWQRAYLLYRKQERRGLDRPV